MRALVTGMVAVALAATAGGSGLRGEEQRVLSSKNITHIGFLANDAKKTADAFADAFGVQASELKDVKPAGLPKGYSGDRKAYTRVSSVRFENIVLEVAQPMGGPSPWRDHIAKYGEGVHHIGLDVTGLEDDVALLEARGGTRVVGAKGGADALVDMMAQLGINVELHKTMVAAPPAAPRDPAARASGGMKTIARIGLMIGDTDKFRAAYVDLFGVKLPAPVDERGALKFPKEFTGDPTAGMRHVFVPFDNLWVNVIQPIGGESPWRDMVARNDGYFLFAVDDVEGTAQALEKKGGKRTLGQPGTPYAYLDMPQLGMTVFLLKSGILPR